MGPVSSEHLCHGARQHRRRRVRAAHWRRTHPRRVVRVVNPRPATVVTSATPQPTTTVVEEQAVAVPAPVSATQASPAGSSAGASASPTAEIGSYNLVVLDEINIAVAGGLISVEEVSRLIAEKPENVGLILTGRYADGRLVQQADLVTEMLKIKHPYDRGTAARPGVEY